MNDPHRFATLLKAGLANGLQVGPRRFPITRVGESNAQGDFATREYTLGDDDFYLVVEGPLASGDPSRCRAILTYELANTEVTCQDRQGRTQYLTNVLRSSDDAPVQASYHGRVYRHQRRVDAEYRDKARQCLRITWDYDCGRRNLAVERWPQGEMAVYEGEIVSLDSITVLKERPHLIPRGATLGALAGGQSEFVSPIGAIVSAVIAVFGFCMMVF